MVFRSSMLAILSLALALEACGAEDWRHAARDPNAIDGNSQKAALRVTGREQLQWEQSAGTDPVPPYQYGVYIDGRLVELPTSCAPAAITRVWCQAPLPRLTPGFHRLEVVSWIVTSNGGRLDSPRAPPLLVILEDAGGS